MIHFPATCNEQTKCCKKHSPVENFLLFINENVIGLCSAFPSDNVMTIESTKVHHATHAYMIQGLHPMCCIQWLESSNYVSYIPNVRCMCCTNAFTFLIATCT